MITCILKLGENIILTIMKDKQIILHRELNKVIDISSYLYKIDVHRVILFVQGISSLEIPIDSYVLSNFKINNISSYFVMSESDLFKLVDLAKAFDAKEFYVVSYLDYISHKYRNIDKILAVDKYLDGYCLIYLEDGKIKDFRKSSNRNIRRMIGQMREEYDVGAVNAKKCINKIELMSSIENFSQLTLPSIPYLDYVQFCTSHLGKNLIEQVVVPDAEKWLEDSKPVGLDDVEEKETEIPKEKKRTPRSSRLRQRRRRHLNRSSKKDSNFIQKIMNIRSLILFIGFVIISVGNIVTLCNNIDSIKNVKSRISINNELTEYSSYNNIDIMNSISKLIDTYDSTIESIEFNNGELSAVLLTDSKDFSDKLEKNLKSSEYVKDVAYLGNKIDIDKNKERIRVDFKI